MVPIYERYEIVIITIRNLKTPDLYPTTIAVLSKRRPFAQSVQHKVTMYERTVTIFGKSGRHLVRSEPPPVVIIKLIASNVSGTFATVPYVSRREIHEAMDPSNH